MFWQVSKLILRIWRNKFRYLFQRYPILWAVTFILPVFYILGSFLFHSAIYRVLSDMVASDMFPDNAAQIIGFSSFSNFGLITLLLITLSILLSPNSTSVNTILTPLPIKLYHQHIGILLPGLLFLLIAQISAWFPVFLAFIRAQLSHSITTVIAVLFGLLCYSVLTLTLYQLSIYVVARVFGKERPGLQSVSLPLVIILGIIALVVSMTLGVTGMASGHVPIWLWLVPAFWMSLIFTGNNIIVGLLVLLSVSIASLYFYVSLLKRNLQLADGTKGYWIPLRRLPFGKKIMQACCIYEWKTALRDQQLVLGLALIIGIFMASVGAVLWLRNQANLLSAQLLLQVILYLGTLLLCFVAQMSWGRDSEYRRLMTIVPLKSQTLMTGKIMANVIAISVLWFTLSGLLVVSGSQTEILASAFRFVPLGILGAFLLGILVPYSVKDPLSMTLMIALVTLLGVPIQFLFQQSLMSLQENILLPDNIVTIAGWIGYIVLCIMFFIGIIWADKTKMEKARE